VSILSNRNIDADTLLELQQNAREIHSPDFMSHTEHLHDSIGDRISKASTQVSHCIIGSKPLGNVSIKETQWPGDVPRKCIWQGQERSGHIMTGANPCTEMVNHTGPRSSKPRGSLGFETCEIGEAHNGDN